MMSISLTDDDYKNIPINLKLETMEAFENLDCENTVMPINADRLEELLILSNYDVSKREALVKGFREGFNIGYNGPELRQDTAKIYHLE